MNQDSSFKNSINFLVTRFTYVIILIIIGFMSLLFWQFHGFNEAEEWVRHTHEVIHSIEETRAQLIDMEAGIRGYILTGKMEFLEPYKKAEKQLDTTLELLEKQVVDNNDQLQLSKKLKLSIADWKNYASEKVDQNNFNSKNLTKRILADQSRGKAIMDNLKDQLNKLQNEEFNLLQIRRNNLKNNYRFFLTILLSSGIFFIGIIVVLFRKHLNAVTLLHQKIYNSSLRVADELKHTTDILKLIMSSTDDVIYVKDRASHMIYCNPILLRLLNTTESELYGKHDIEFLGEGNGGEENIRNDEKVMSSGKAETMEESVTWKDGAKKVYLSQKYPWFDQNGKVIGLIGLSRDINNLKMTQGQLEEAIKTRDDFLSVASHELKTPLSSLKLQAQHIQKLFSKEKYDELTLPRLKKFVDLTDKQVERLDRLVEDMLDISRIRSGRLAIKPVHTTLNEIILGVLERLKATMDNAGTPAQLSLQENVIGVWDKMRLEQVVTNLLTNAMRYGDRKPIFITLNVEEGIALLTVKDQGIGMSKETLARIFQQFERGVSIDISGLGLGLFITRQIIELHGGKIWAESEGKNQGSTFYVRLPRFSSSILK